MSLLENTIVRSKGRPVSPKTEEEIAIAKQKRAEYQRNYQKKLRESDPTHIRNLGKKSYYKSKYGLDETLENLYGEYAGEVFKLHKTFRDLIDKQPSLKTHLIQLLNGEPVLPLSTEV